MESLKCEEMNRDKSRNAPSGNKEMFSKEKKKADFGKWFQRDNLMILVLSGVLLFIIALPTKEDNAEQSEISTTQNNTIGQETSPGNIWNTTKSTAKEDADMSAVHADSGGTELDYVTYLEEKLESALGKISGVGKVQVMITLQSSEELVVEKDEPLVRSNTNETDSEGGNRIVAQLDAGESTIYRTDGSISEPYVVKTILPKVEGILVVAQGADSGTVNKNITEIAQALFGVEAHKVKVVPMEKNK